MSILASLLAAFTLSTAAPVAAEPDTISATCTPYLNGQAGAAEPCVVIVNAEDGVMAVGFVLESSGAVLYVGTPRADGVDVALVGVSEEPIQATGRCEARGSVLACSATVQGEQGSLTLAVKAEAN